MTTDRMARVAALGAAFLAGSVQAQLAGNLVDVADDAQAPDWCGVSHTYTAVASPSVGDGQAGGAACADFDGDGLIDLWLAGNLGAPSRLYRNLGDGTFMDVAAERGVADAAAASACGVFADYDNDGDLDLTVATHPGPSGVPFGPLFRQFRNSGAAGGHDFHDVSGGAGFALAPLADVTTTGWSSGLAFGDYDQDGWLDLVAPFHWTLGPGNMWRLFRSEPNRTPGASSDPDWSPRSFVDVTQAAGLDFVPPGEAWQPRWVDFDRDGLLDLHVIMDYEVDYLFRNAGNGTFHDVCSSVGLNGTPPEGRNEMGTAMGDIDNDGDLDFHLTNLFESDRFYRCDSFPGGASYVDVAPQTGLFDSAWGWGDVFFDFDLDGDLDHATVSGWRYPSAIPWHNAFHINLFPQTLGDGVTVKWQNALTLLPEFTKVFTPQGDNARGLSWLDYDLDGDVDLVVTRKAEPTAVYRNTLASSHRWLQVDLVNSGGSLNTVNALAWLKTADRIQMRQVSAGSSFLCQEPPRLHFGLGPAPVAPPEPSAPPLLVDPALRTGGAGSIVAALPGGPAGPAFPGGGPAWSDPAWLVVRWPDGPLQIVRNPQPNQVLVVTRSAVDDRGDLDGDGHLTAADEAMLLLAASDFGAYQAAYPLAPGVITGDVDGNGFLELADHAAWSLLPPH